MDVVSEVASAKQDGKVHLAQIGKKRSSLRVSNSLLLYKMTSRSTQCHSCEEEKVKNDGNPLYWESCRLQVVGWYLLDPSSISYNRFPRIEDINPMPILMQVVFPIPSYIQVFFRLHICTPNAAYTENIVRIYITCQLTSRCFLMSATPTLYS